MKYFVKTLPKFLAVCVVVLCTMRVGAVTDENDIHEIRRLGMPEIFSLDESLSVSQVLAENEGESDSAMKSDEDVLVIPDENEDKTEERNCVTVCDNWGRDCIINPVTGQRKCRRMCKSFGQECI